MDKKAFPVHPEAHGLKDAQCEALSGMDLRDYFAAKAMQAMCSSEHFFCKGGDVETTWVANEAYAMADAMLKARNA